MGQLSLKLAGQLRFVGAIYFCPVIKWRKGLLYPKIKQTEEGKGQEEEAEEVPEVTDVDSNKASRLESDRSPMQSSTQEKDHFPWDRLPHELRIKILRNLRPRDLDSCRLLNRETSELIRRNKRLLERSVIAHL
ncbi:F-box domain protein, partial [Ostertagia ostertagi]